MRFPWHDRNKDGQPDDHPFDTWNEIYQAWLAAAITALAIIGGVYIWVEYFR